VPTVHSILADAAVAAVAIAIIWCLILAVTARPGGRLFERLQTVVVLAIALASAAGAVTFALGARPTDGLHLVYGVVAMALLPLARSLRSGASRHDALLLLAACALLGGVLFRLFTTG
jgi:hypothetical protein